MDSNRNGQQDTGEPAISGVTVKLLDSTGTSVLQTTTTDVNGLYLFTVAPGSYVVQFVTPAGAYDKFTTANVGNDASDSDASQATGKTGVITVASGQTDLTIDAGLLPIDLELAKSVDNSTPLVGSNVVFTITVANNNAAPGVSTATGVTVKDVLPAGLSFVSSSASQGSYSSGTNLWTVGTLAPGVSATLSITATVTTGGTKTNFAQVQTANQIDTDSTPGNNTDNTPHEDDEAVVSLTPPAQIGDYVWVDSNRNGQQDSGELGISGVTVKLLDSTGTTVLQTTTTDGSGLYSFTVAAGTYVVQFITPAGAYDTFTRANVGLDVTDSDANTATGKTGPITVVSGQVDNTNDAGLLPIDLELAKSVNNSTPLVGSNVVFTITVTNNNAASGVSTATGVTVKDVLPAGLSYVSDDGSGAFNSGTGVWTVGTLAPGASATLHVTATVTTGGTKTNYAQVTTADQIDTDSIPNNNAGPTPSEDDESSVSLTPPAQIGDYVWVDSNRNGQQDTGEPAIPGVTVKLLDSSGTTVLQTTTTDGSGLYSFTVAAGTYVVQFTTGGGYDKFTTANVGSDVTDSDANQATGKTGTYTLISGEFNSTVDAGLLPIDLELTKSVDNSTPLVGSNVVFTITITNNNAAPGVSTATGVSVKDVLPAGLSYVSDDGGGAFNSGTGVWTVGTLAPGASATLHVTAKVTTGGTKTNYTQVTTADQIDTDSTPNNGTPPTPHEDDESSVSLTPPAQIGDYVWVDSNRNGQQDAGEPAVSGVTVKLLDSTGTSVLQTTTTDVNGLYLFTVAPGNYVVQFVTPAGAYDKFTTADSGSDVTDSDANQSTGKTGTYTLASGEFNSTVDAGLLPIDLELTKTVSNSTPALGSNVVFTITIKNNNASPGVSTATGVAVKDVLPAGLSYVSSSTSQGSYSNGTSTWTVGTLSPGATATLTITATVATLGTKTNFAQVQTADQVDVDSMPGNNTDTGSRTPFEDDEAKATLTPPQLSITKTADMASIAAGQTAGWVVTITNIGTITDTNVSLSDPLPPGAGNDINWHIDSSGTGLGAGTTPANFQITGPVGSQTLVLSAAFIAGGDSLTPGQSISVHLTGVTTTNDLTYSANPALGILGQYAVLFDSAGGNQLSITNDTVSGNIGVYGPGSVAFSGPGTISGQVDFSAANTGQFHNTNGQNVGPTSVNYGVSAVTTARNLVISLSSGLGGLTGTNLAIASGDQTVNESAGTLQTYQGVNYRVFNVTSYAMTAGHNLTIVGDGSGNAVVFNVAYASNSNINGGVILSGTGLSNDLVMWNFTSSGKTIQMAANGGTFVGVMLLPNDKFTGSSVNIQGRVFGGGYGNMQIVSGTNVYAPPASTSTLVNTATATAANVPPKSSTATIQIVADATFAGAVFCDDNLNGVRDANEAGDAGAIVTLTDSTNTINLTTTTDSFGNYLFDNVPAGTYTVTFVTASSGHVAEVSHGSVVVSTSAIVTVAPTDVSIKNFAEVDFGSVTGYVYLDINDSGIKGDVAGESGIGNVTVTLTGKDYLGNAVSKTTKTDSSGKYSFTGLLPSDSAGYTLKETQPAGYLDGLETVGTINGLIVGSVSITGDSLVGVVLPGCNNDGVNYNFGEHGIFHGLTATIGFWHNANGQSLIKSFGTTSNGLTLANWLATNMPNLFGKNAPAFNVNATAGTNLTNRSNTDVANYFLSLFNVQGQKSYAQVLATSFAVFTTTNSLNTGSTSRALATKFGFTLSNTGSGAATYAVPQADWAAFGITSTSGATKTIWQLLFLANQYAVKGILNNNNTTLITETNDVFSAINNQGDIGTGLNLVADGTQDGVAVALGQVYAGFYLVSVDGLSGNLAGPEADRIQDAIDQLNDMFAPFGVVMSLLTDGIDATPDIQIHLADTSSIGGVAQGVLGVTQLGGQITIINGWNWYTNADSSAVGDNQFDFQTVVTHEMGHAVGLGHSADATSVMYATLATGTARRRLSDADLQQLADHDSGGADALRIDFRSAATTMLPDVNLVYTGSRNALIPDTNRFVAVYPAPLTVSTGTVLPGSSPILLAPGWSRVGANLAAGDAAFASDGDDFGLPADFDLSSAGRRGNDARLAATVDKVFAMATAWSANSAEPAQFDSKDDASQVAVVALAESDFVGVSAIAAVWESERSMDSDAASSAVTNEQSGLSPLMMAQLAIPACGLGFLSEKERKDERGSKRRPSRNFQS